MKKLFFLSTMLLIAFMAQAQVKVSPKMTKGQTKTYTSTGVVELPGQAAVTINEETTYAVADATADGYLVSITTTQVSSDATADNFMGRLMLINSEMLKGQPIRVKTDKDGKAVGIQNFEEVKKNAVQAAERLIDAVLEQVPQVKDMLSKEMLMGQVKDQLTEQKTIDALTLPTSVLALNGKTIALGAQDEYTNSQGMKMKRMYLLGGQNKITATAKMDNDPETMKKLIIEQVEKMAPDQAEMVKQNIDAVMASGMIKFEGSDKTTYELADDGWMKSIEEESTTNTMGQEIKSKTTVRLK